MLNRFKKHYKNIDRRFGNFPVYRENNSGTLYAFGKECEALKKRFREWSKPNCNLSWFLYTDEAGEEFMKIDFSYYDILKFYFPELWLIHSEEVYYNFYQK